MQPRPLALTDREVLGGFLRAHPQEISWYSFVTLALWNRAFRYLWTFVSPELLLVLTRPADLDGVHLLQPLGVIDDRSSERLLDWARGLLYPLKIYGVSPRFLREHPALVAHFDACADPDASEYLYRASDLATLPGRRFSYKRKLIERARARYVVAAEAVGRNNLDACRAVVAEHRHDQNEDGRWFAAELEALDFALTHFTELGLTGRLVVASGEPAAFSIYERQNGTVVVHFERALRRFEGLSQVINQDVAQTVAALGATLINRQDDAGLPGLRQAKRSYHPVAMATSYTLTLRPTATA